MIYLDYSATTPISLDVLDSITKTHKNYFANSNSSHALGLKSKELLDSAVNQMAKLLNIKADELIFTSGATEANNLAFRGCLKNYGRKKNNIIISRLEHPSIIQICKYLESIGYEITYVNNDANGVIDFNDLKEKINENTFLVSICAVNSELGIRQPLKIIRQVIKKENPDIIFHSDITQALGKVNLNLHDVDLASASAHKIYGPVGIGFLYKASNIHLDKILYGSTKYNNFRPGTPPLPLIVGFSKAMRITLNNLDQKIAFIRKLNDKLVKSLKKYPKVLINSTTYSIPNILNISLTNIKAETMLRALEEHEIYVSTSTACASQNLSDAIMAVYDDKKRASSTLRISLSHLTTLNEVKLFLEAFDECYNKLDLDME